MSRMRGWALAALLSIVAMPVSAETAAQVFKQVSPSVVVVIAYDAAGKPSELGSGVALPNGSVATNCHVLKDGVQYRVRYQDKDYPAQLRKSDWDRDTCSLTVSGLHAPPVVLGNTKALEVGAPVYAIGAPEGLQLTLSEGIVSSLRNVDGGSYIQTTAAISPGSSGGGLFDDQGRLLGLTSFFMSEGQQLNFALPVEWIEALPQRATQQMAKGTSEVDWLNRAAALEKNQDWNGLMALAKQWTDGFPNTATAWFALGEACERDGQPAQAMDAYHKGLQINPQNEVAWNNLGLSYDDAGQYAKAIDAYRQALRIDPQYADAWDGLGNAYSGLSQYAQATDAYRQALRINPQDADVWYNLGVVLSNAGQNAQAIDADRQTLRINSRNAKAWYNLGVVYGHTGQLAQAIDALRQSLQINPQDAMAWDLLGLAYVGADQPAQAIDAEHKALQINPELAPAWSNLGVAYLLSGRKDQALDVYQHLKTLSPELADKLFDLIVPQ